MKRILLGALLGAALAMPAYALDEDAVAAARDLLEASRAEQMLDIVTEQIKANILMADPDAGAHAEVISQFFAEHLGYHQLEADLITLYAEAFTTGELRELAHFYRSPVGQKSLDLMPELMQRSNALTMQRLQAALPKLEAELQAIKAEQQAGQ
ncbi:Protein of unknown function DUF2059 [Ferrimonas balearica DSM 9799]|uniref:DUF2059 domain-containing protein n=1 Tax=Ferrimonas balearica (strain DSM 9799 / CCM 4581 / KCTC 23876 / PAT) TaxID=550540 RepID=E1SN48_FERBD|nr:DUF2059 domain-containing protein [Ferrimonas balearica]ADN77706.1 Protein of unknown function DUF2059 [Ferrimonas balearica DSM 9799]